MSLAQKLVKADKPPVGKIEVELFWKGMRDYLDHLKNGKKAIHTPQDLADLYDLRFYSLRKDIERFDEIFREKHPMGFAKLKGHNYVVSDTNSQSKLYKNLGNTEIDIVLQTQDYLFIGEAKGESDIKGKSSYVLVHQLIRQYVMAKMLVDLTEPGKDKKKEIVPFIVCDSEKLKSIKNHSQVNFMIWQGWLDKRNIFTWETVLDRRYNPTGITKAGARDRRYSDLDTATQV